MDIGIFVANLQKLVEDEADFSSCPYTIQNDIDRYDVTVSYTEASPAVGMRGKFIAIPRDNSFEYPCFGSFVFNKGTFTSLEVECLKEYP